MKIKRCSNCGRYSLKSECPECGHKTKNPHPPKFSPQDKHGKYRRMMKKNMK